MKTRCLGFFYRLSGPLRGASLLAAAEPGPLPLGNGRNGVYNGPFLRVPVLVLRQTIVLEGTSLECYTSLEIRNPRHEILTPALRRRAVVW